MRSLCGTDHYPAALLAVAGFGFPGDRPMPARPLDDDAWSATFSAARQHRLTGLLHAAVDAGVLPTSDGQARQARAAYRSVMLRVLALERELLAVVDRLATAGIPARVLKGSAVANLDYRQPALRSFVDLDLLVRPADFDAAVHALTSDGFRRKLAEPRPGFDRRFDKGTTLVGGTGFEVDLHRTFVLGPWGALVDLDSLWAGAEEFTVAGRPLLALSRSNRFLHACYHATLGDWPLRLASLRDVAEMLPDAELGRSEVLATARAWGGETVVASAIADTRRLLRLPASGVLSTWADDHVPTRRDEARLALYTHQDKTFAAQALATIPALPGLRDKAAYLRALLAPDRQYTADRHASTLARLRFAIREVRRGRGHHGRPV